MDKRYQVFLSSTYADLKEERQHVLQALMEMDCIPAGMEIFPAADEEQWTFIQKVIDDCDYYLLIIGGRYGSVTSEGISYTEKEFDYAVQKGLKIIALVHGAPENIPFGKSETDPDRREKLMAFKEKVMTGRLVKFWESAKELPGLVALSLSKTIKTHPAIGWVRADAVANDEILTDLNTVRKKYENLVEEYESISKKSDDPIIDNIADIDSEFIIHGTFKLTSAGMTKPYEYKTTWRELFSKLSPYLREHPSEGTVIYDIKKVVKSLLGGSYYSFEVNEEDFQTIGIQLKAYDLISITYLKTTKGGMALFWALTEKGERFMIENRVMKKQDY